MNEDKTISYKRILMYFLGFIFNLSSAIPTYVNSTFLAGFTTEKLVGIVYTVSSIIAIAAFIEIPKFIKRFGNVKVTVALLLLEIFSLSGLIFGSDTLSLISSFILNFVTIALINFTLDVLLEEFSSDSKTGKIRGLFLMISNAAWLISPILASWIISSGSIRNIYTVSAVLLIPVTILVFQKLKNIKETPPNEISFWKNFKEVWVNRDIKAILIIQFLLQFFYAWMIIYTPIYLNQTIGFNWVTIGVIFTIMLAPFVILEAPLGRLADNRFGEKEMLSIGFIIMGISTCLIAFISGQNIIIWSVILFITRIGAAMVEVMSDTYFFKQIDGTKTNIIGFSRMARPMAYIISPIIATFFFIMFDMKILFIFLGLFMLYGLRYSFALKDTK